MTINTIDLGLCEGQLHDDTGAESVVVYCEREATTRIAGERDSFGTEWIHMCEDCAASLRDYLREAAEAEYERRQQTPCERCKKQDPGNLMQRRSSWDLDYEEPAWLCGACRQHDRLEEQREYCSYKKATDPCTCDQECTQFVLDEYGFTVGTIVNGVRICNGYFFDCEAATVSPREKYCAECAEDAASDPKPEVSL